MVFGNSLKSDSLISSFFTSLIQVTAYFLPSSGLEFQISLLLEPQMIWAFYILPATTALANCPANTKLPLVIKVNYKFIWSFYF